MDLETFEDKMNFQGFPKKLQRILVLSIVNHNTLKLTKGRISEF